MFLQQILEEFSLLRWCVWLYPAALCRICGQIQSMPSIDWPRGHGGGIVIIVMAGPNKPTPNLPPQKKALVREING